MNASSADPRPEPAADRLFALWESADRRVPFPSLYSLIARAAPGTSALELAHLRHCTFVYRVTDAFVADLEFHDDRAGPATLRAQSFGFKLVPIPGRIGLISSADAEHLLELELGRREWKFWRDFFSEITPATELERSIDSGQLPARYRLQAWHSLRLEQPFGAGISEPSYHFRKLGSRHEFRVGARSGDIRERRVPDDFPFAPPPQLP